MAISLVDIATVANKATPFPGHQIARDFTGTLYVVTEDTSGDFLANVYTSTDQGVTWTLNAWDTGIGNAQTSASFSQLLVDKLNNTLYLIRHDDPGTGGKTSTLWRRDADSETWVEHGAIFGTSGVSKSDIGRPTYLMDYGFKADIGNTLSRTVSGIHFMYFRDRTDPDRLLYQNSFTSGEELIDTVAPATHKDKFIPSILPTGILTLAAQQDESVAADHIDFYFRLASLDIGSLNWTEEGTVFSTSTYTGQRLQDHITTLQGNTKVLFTANSDQVYLGERWGTGLWTVDQVTDGTTTPTMSGAGSFYAQLSADVYGRIYAVFASSAGVMDVWQRETDGVWSREISLTSITTTAGVDKFFDNKYLANNEDPIMVSGNGVMGTLWAGGTLKFFRGFDATFTPEDEPEYECPTEPTRTSVVLEGEGVSAGAFPDIKPDHTYSEDDGYSTEKFRAVLGYTQTVARFETGRRRISVRYNALSETDKDTIRTFLNARKNNEEAFTWTLPDSGSTIKVALVANSVQYRKRAPGVYRVSFDLMELLT